MNNMQFNLEEHEIKNVKRKCLYASRTIKYCSY